MHYYYKLSDNTVLRRLSFLGNGIIVQQGSVARLILLNNDDHNSA